MCKVVFSGRVGIANAGRNTTPFPLIACPVLDTGVSLVEPERENIGRNVVPLTLRQAQDERE